MTQPTLSDDERKELQRLVDEPEHCERLADNGNDGMRIQVSYAEDALGAAMVRYRKTLLHQNVLEPVTNTPLDQQQLLHAAMTWLKTTRIKDLPSSVGEGIDVYLKVVAEAAQLSYEETRRRFRRGDPGLLVARMSVKHFMWSFLYINPAGILQVHDETVVSEDTTVESTDASEDLAHRSR